MPKASVTRQISREKQKLIDFVLDIEKYPEFIPFCIDSKVYERKEKDDEIAIMPTVAKDSIRNPTPNAATASAP